MNRKLICQILNHEMMLATGCTEPAAIALTAAIAREQLDGELEHPVDLEFDRKTGAITTLTVPGPGKFCFFPGRESEYIIPWCCICQIGDDIILVEVKEEKCFHKDHLL